MWLRLRNTARRGRASEPARVRRIRSWRLRRAAPRLATFVIVSVLRSWSILAADLAGLAGLAADLLTGVVHSPASVGLDLPARAHLRGYLADQLLVDPDHREARRVLELEGDAVGRVDLDLVAVAEVERQLLAVERGS